MSRYAPDKMKGDSKSPHTQKRAPGRLDVRGVSEEVRLRGLMPNSAADVYHLEPDLAGRYLNVYHVSDL